MEKEALQKAKEWVNNPYFAEKDRQEIQALIDKNDTKELVERFYKDLEFGTGGIRGILAMGNNRMNRYNVRKATQALATVIKKTGTPDPKVAISYDSRHFSFDFAKETASVLAGNGIKAFIYKRMNPVCLLSYSVRYHKAIAGVMITASHNPPEYNGYKLYWDDGCQVTAPHDNNVIEAYYALNDLNQISYMPFEEAEKNGFINWVGEDVENSYFEMVKSKTINPKLCQSRGTELSFVYTPLHGTGLIPVTTAFKNIGLTNFAVVEEQTKPDGNFPTVKSPNPENAEALDLAVKLMKDRKADLAFGSDPDADRIGVAVSHRGEVHYLSGNQMGILMLHYICSNLKEQGRMPKEPYFVKTIVTTTLQDKIAASFGVKTENTLTGFKWICGRMREIESKEPNKTFLFGTEESFGYLTHDQVRDKDGVAPITMLAEMALWYKTRNMTLMDALDSIYEQYGYHHEGLLNMNYYGKEGSEKILRIMDRLRKNPPLEFCGEKVTEIDDIKTGKKKNMSTNKMTDIALPSSNVLGFIFESGNRVFCRPSGTEPKIKFYTMVQDGKPGTLAEKKERAKKKTNAFIDLLKDICEKA